MEKQEKYVLGIRDERGWGEAWFCTALYKTGTKPDKCFVSDFRLAGVFDTREQAEAYVRYVPINVKDRASVLTLDAAKRNITYHNIHKNSKFTESFDELTDITSFRNAILKEVLPALITTSRTSVITPLNGMIGDAEYDEKIVDLAIKYANETTKKIVEDRYWYNDVFGYVHDPIPEAEIIESIKANKNNG